MTAECPAWVGVSHAIWDRNLGLPGEGLEISFGERRKDGFMDLDKQERRCHSMEGGRWKGDKHPNIDSL